MHYLGHIWGTSLPLQKLSFDETVEAVSILIKHIRRGLWDGGVSSQEREKVKEIIASRAQWTHQNIYQEVLKLETDIETAYVIDQTPMNVFLLTDT